MFCRYRPSATRHTPVRSGFPSALFGAGADKLGLPSGVRGVLGNCRFTHCANKIAMAVPSISSSLSDQALSVALIFTHAFHQFHIGEEFERDRHLPRTRVGLRIINGDFDIEMTKVAAMKTFDGM